MSKFSNVKLKIKKLKKKKKTSNSKIRNFLGHNNHLIMVCAHIQLKAPTDRVR